jgi:colanic acid biosynthesis glycosyl transferase WcaI
VAAPPGRITVVGANFTPEQTGNAPYTTGLAVALADAGAEVFVLTTPPHYPQWQVSESYDHWSRESRHQGVCVRRLRHYVPRSPSPLRRLISETSFGLRAVTQRWRDPDVVICVSPALFATAIVALRRKLLRSRAPWVIWVQDLYGLGVAQTDSASGRLAGLVAAIERWTLTSADRVVVIHPRFADHLVRHLGLDEAKVSVIRNWSHVDLRPARGRDEERTNRGWPEDVVVALHAGNQGLKQGLENIVEAARVAQQRCDPVRYVLLGNGNQHDRLVALSVGVSTIEFIDTVDDDEFAALLQSCDVLLLNESKGVREMSVPSKLTTYFAAGRPIVAATHADGAAAEELAAAGSGTRVEPGVARALHEAVLDLVADHEASELHSRSGAAYREAHLTESAAVAKFTDLLADVASAGG